MAKTITPPKKVGPPAGRPSNHLSANLETIEKMARKAERETNNLANKLNASIRERRPSPYLGETVLYRMPEGPSAGEQRPAIVVMVHGHEGNQTRCALKIICSPDHDGVGVLDEPNVAYGTNLGQWLPNDPTAVVEQPKLEDRVPVGEAVA